MRIKINGVEKRWTAPMRPDYGEGLAYGVFVIVENGPDKGVWQVIGHEHFLSGKVSLMARDTMAIVKQCPESQGSALAVILEAREKIRRRFVSGCDVLLGPDGAIDSINGDSSADYLRGFGLGCGGRTVISIKHGAAVERYPVGCVCAFCESSAGQVTCRFAMIGLLPFPESAPVPIETLAPPPESEEMIERPQEKRGPGRPRTVAR